MAGSGFGVGFGDVHAAASVSSWCSIQNRGHPIAWAIFWRNSGFRLSVRRPFVMSTMYWSEMPTASAKGFAVTPAPSIALVRFFGSIAGMYTVCA